jgi:hypothetical protein
VLLVCGASVAFSLAGCRKQLNPEFCDAHPSDDRCRSMLDSAVDAAVTTADALADAGLVCPTDYVAIGAEPSRYRVEDSINDWRSAATRCAADGTGLGANTHLVVLTTSGERAALAPIMDRERWVGHSDQITEGMYIPVTDEPSGYPALAALMSPPWSPTEPNGTGDCAVMSATLLLLDRDCTNEDQAYVCECDLYPDDPDNY